MKSYIIESSVLFTREKEKELTDVMKESGEITSLTGGFPLGPTQYHWNGTEDGAEKLKMLGATVHQKR